VTRPLLNDYQGIKKNAHCSPLSTYGGIDETCRNERSQKKGKIVRICRAKKRRKKYSTHNHPICEKKKISPPKKENKKNLRGNERRVILAQGMEGEKKRLLSIGVL